MITLSKEQVLMFHEKLIEATGGSAGILAEGMLDSALSNPFQSFGGEELYPSIQAKAAQLCFGLIKNHSMVVTKNETARKRNHGNEQADYNERKGDFHGQKDK